jgi:AcrR family transcriptional regulator
MARIADPNRRSDILAAARATFLDRGFLQTRMADIAQRAGVAAGTIYLYFESKEAIVLELAEQHFAGLARVTLPALQQPNPADAIAEAVHAALAYVADERDLLRLIRLDQGLSSLAAPRAARDGFHRALAAQLAGWIDRGVLPAYEPLVLAELISALIERAAELCLLYEQGDLATYESTLISLLRTMLLGERAPTA